MFELVFLTSNKTKIAHARHLCKHENIAVTSYRNFYYGVSYNEPRIYDREELLKQSFDDAKVRWVKYFKPSTNKLFIIEDTSVIIDSLSTDDNEVPGVDIKYWMKENQFSDVDKKLKSLGNNRNVTVQSHLILYLNQELQNIYKKDYIIFKSYSKGYITDHEHDIKTQPLYPWLDKNSFNKWFVPSGYTKPISALDIEDADKVDFRKGAFEDMLQLLKQHNLLSKQKDKTVDWKLGLYPFYIICGPTCSGKTTCAEYLNIKHGYYHIEASDFMYLNYYETHGLNSSVKISEFAKDILKKNPTAVVDRVIKHISSIGNLPIVITGYRSPDEVNATKEILALDKNYKLFFLDAKHDVRFGRWVERQRDNEVHSLEQFEKTNQVQNEIGLSNINLLPNDKMINNFTNHQAYHEYIKSKLSLGGEVNPVSNLQSLNLNADSIGLEEAILLSMFSEKISSDMYSFFTTTQLSHLIKKVLLVDKHKDNVSRYFNQKYHPYYDLRGTPNKLLIRLSPTGVSHANYLLKRMMYSI